MWVNYALGRSRSVRSQQALFGGNPTMTTNVEKSTLVNVPVSMANQWTQFGGFPQFMSGVKAVTQLDDDEVSWVAEIMGVRRQ